MADKRPEMVTGLKEIDPDPTSRHFQKEHVGHVGVGVNSTINAINAGQNTPPHAVMPRVKNAIAQSPLPASPQNSTAPNNARQGRST